MIGPPWAIPLPGSFAGTASARCSLGSGGRSRLLNQVFGVQVIVAQVFVGGAGPAVGPDLVTNFSLHAALAGGVRRVAAVVTVTSSPSRASA